MSRYPYEKEDESKRIESESVKAICNLIHIMPFIHVLPSCSPNRVDIFSYPGQTMTQVERNDPMVGIWLLECWVENIQENRYYMQIRNIKQCLGILIILLSLKDF